MTLTDAVAHTSAFTGLCSRCHHSRRRVRCMRCVVNFVRGGQGGGMGHYDVPWCRRCLSQNKEVLALLALVNA
jgi:hypothetical protein